MKNTVMIRCRHQTKALTPVLALFASLMLILPSGASALNFLSDATQSKWTASGDKFECRLAHPIPAFGEAVFSRRAGQVSSFQLSSFESPSVASAVQLVAKTPNWKPAQPDLQIATIQASETNAPLRFESPLTEQILSQLQAGRLAVFSDWQWYQNNATLSVGLSTVNFLPAYRQYQHCVTRLFHLSYEELRVSDVVFARGSDKLPGRSKQRLQQVAELVLADPSIGHCHVAAFTDEVGSSRANLELSWRRSVAVQDYLVSLGINAEMITTSYYAEANWVRSNGDSGDNTQNRKVTVRLDRK